MYKTLNLKDNTSKNELFVKATLAAVFAAALFAGQHAFAAITSQLDLGDTGQDVTELQTYLTANPLLYPSGMITGYFGRLTEGGVQQFQIKEGIVSQGTPASTGFGRVGPTTMNALNMRINGGPVGDVYAPLIRTVNVNPDSNGAAVTWTSSESTQGKVYYSTSPIRISNTFDSTGRFSGEPVVTGTLADNEGVARSTHTVNINGLQGKTTYYYLVVIYDTAKNVSFTTPASFRTD